MSGSEAQGNGLHDDLEDAWADFRRSLVRRNRSPATVKVYRKSFDAFWRWAATAGLPADPSAITHRDLNAWVDSLLETPVYRNGRPVLVTDPDSGEKVHKLLEPTTRRILFVNLRPFFTWWAREENVDSPFERADAPPVPRDPGVPLVDIEDLRAVLATCSPGEFIDRRDEAILRVMIDTGARRGELVNLTVDDFDNRNDLLALDGKTGQRAVPVSLSTGEALGRYLRARKRHRSAHLPALWLSKKGALAESGISQMLARRCDLAGVAHINPHRLRHTWAHLFRAEGGAEGDLMYLAGWSSTAMAHRYGRSAAMERAQDSARRIAVGDRL